MPQISPLALLAFVAVTACAGSRPLRVELIRGPSHHVEVWSAHAEDAGDAVLVRGLVRRTTIDQHPLWGHVHIEARFRDSRAPLVAEAVWAAPSTESARTASYSARLPIPDEAAVTDIIVSYAPGRHADEANAGPSS